MIAESLNLQLRLAENEIFNYWIRVLVWKNIIQITASLQKKEHCEQYNYNLLIMNNHSKTKGF